MISRLRLQGLLAFLMAWTMSAGLNAEQAEPRYGHYRNAGKNVWFEFNRQNWVVRFHPNATVRDREEAVAFWESALAQRVPDNGVLSPERMLRGLVRLQARRAVTPAEWAKVAALLEDRPAVKKVYPAMERGGGLAFYDEHVALALREGDWEANLDKIVKTHDLKVVKVWPNLRWASVAAPAHLEHDGVQAANLLAHDHADFLRWAEPVLIRGVSLASTDAGSAGPVDGGESNIDEAAADSGRVSASADSGPAANEVSDSGHGDGESADSGSVSPLADSGSSQVDAGGGGLETEVDAAVPFDAGQPLVWETDPLLADQWHLSRGEGDAIPGVGEIYADDAWRVTRGDSDVVVAVLDTGTDMNHPDLVANLVGGLDAIANDEDPDAQCSSSQDGRDVDSSCPDDQPFFESHGTSVSGLVAAKGMNGIGASGVCPDCSLYPVRMIGGGYMESLSNAVTFIATADAGADVFNNSWGPGISRFFPLSNSEVAAFDHVRENGRGGLGAPVLFAAGNDTRNTNGDPYNRHPDTLSVAASTNLDDWAVYSNYGSTVDIAAPSRGGAVEGDNYGLVTPDVTGNSGYSEDDYYMEFGGTSGAAPVASGVMGLILSVNPQLTLDQAKLVLLNSADPIVADKVNWPSVIGSDIENIFAYDDTGHSIGFGYGRVNAHAAVLAASNPPAQGGPCTDACAVCDEHDRCLMACESQDDCLKGTRCVEEVCLFRTIDPTAVGEPCNDDCEFCVDALDTEFEEQSICTAECVADEECPYGFDCRLLAEDGPRVCAVGNRNVGEADGVGNCYSQDLGTSVVVPGMDGENYCTDICIGDSAGQCPYAFHCAYAECECSQGGRRWCWEYTCREVPEFRSNWYAPICFPNDNFGVACRTDDDCVRGEYCTPDGTCAWDDREGCTICKPCLTDNECGLQESCVGADEDTGTPGGCLTACAADGACPGNSVCRQVATDWGQFDFCLSPENGPNDSWCDLNWTCDVACRDDVPCAEGKICEAGVCENKPEETLQTQNEPVKTQAECACSSTRERHSSSPFWALSVLGLAWWRRRRAV